jgi:glycosyltransferase involved in cell wall biosynthesis
MKILHLSGAMVWGGNEQQLTDLIVNLNKEGIASMIFCFINSPIEKYAKENGITYYSLPRAGAFSFKVAKELAKCIQANQIDLLHIHTSNMVTTNLLLGVFYNRRINAVFSKKGISFQSSSLSRIKYNYRNIKKIIAVSNAVAVSLQNTIAKKNHHKIIRIYDGIIITGVTDALLQEYSVRRKFNIPADKKIVGNIANHYPAKDLLTWVETIHHFVNQLMIKDVVFVQIGAKTNFTQELVDKIKAYGLEDYVLMTDFLPNAKNYISGFDIYMMTSKFEGLPLTIFEAFQYKTPVVSTMAGGIPEAVMDGENGYLANVGDAGALALALKKLIGDSDKQKAFAEKSYQLLIEKFDAGKLVKDVMNVYKNAISA